MAQQNDLSSCHAESASDWPLPLPREVVLQSLLPAVDAHGAWSQLRLTCRALRDAVDGSVDSLAVRANPIHDYLPSMVKLLPRMRGLTAVVLWNATDICLTAFAALAPPLVPQLTRLDLPLSCDELSPDPEVPRLQHAGHVLAQQLTCLQNLEKFSSPQDHTVWGPAAAPAVARALGRLPKLRELRLSCDINGRMLQQAHTELGGSAWPSLEKLDIVPGPTPCLQALAETPLPRLTSLGLTCDCDRLAPIVTGAAWAPQLRSLTLSVRFPSTPGLLSDLRLPNLETLALSWHNYGYPPEHFAPISVWDLPNLKNLEVWGYLVGEGFAASLAATPLPALTQLKFVVLYPRAPALATLLHSAPWVPQLRVLTTCAILRDNAGAEACRALAAAPLTALRRLHLGDCSGVDVKTAAVLAGAPWLQGMEKLSLASPSDAVLAALRSGSGGFAELEAAGRVCVSESLNF